MTASLIAAPPQASKQADFIEIIVCNLMASVTFRFRTRITTREWQDLDLYDMLVGCLEQVTSTDRWRFWEGFRGQIRAGNLRTDPDLQVKLDDLLHEIKDTIQKCQYPIYWHVHSVSISEGIPRP